MSTEMYENLVKAVGGDTSALPDRLKTTYLRAVCEALGVDTSGMTDNLETSYYQLIIDNYAVKGAVAVLDEAILDEHVLE